MNDVIQVAGIPLLTAVACIYFSIKLLVFKDTDSIRGSMSKALKDKDRYAVKAGVLLLVFGLCSLIMGVLLFYNTTAAIAEICISLAVTAGLWMDIEKKYGAAD